MTGPKGKNIVALVPDAYGANGGIARYNRDFYAALAKMPEVAEIDALMRTNPQREKHDVPDKVRVNVAGAGNKRAYIFEAVKRVMSPRRIDIVLCAHFYMFPLAWLIAKVRGARLVTLMYGIDVWKNPLKPNYPLSRLKDSDYVTISEFTGKKFEAWSGVPVKVMGMVPPTFEQSAFKPQPKSPEVVAKYGLEGKRVLLTLGRLDPDERYKGFDEVISVMPKLLAVYPNLVYVIAGEGGDRARLEKRVADMGLQHAVIFTGYVDEALKAALYGSADGFVLPGRGEGFGIVLLEAIASGIPALASVLDASREALLDGELGEIVDPDDQADLIRGILNVLQRPKGVVPDLLNYFSIANFDERVAKFMRAKQLV